MIQTFAPHPADQPLTDGLGPWCFTRRVPGRPEHRNPGSHGDGSDVLAVRRIVVTNQIRRRFPAWCGLAQLLADPCVRWCSCDTDMHDASRAEFGDETGEERPEADVRDLDEVTAPAVLGVGAPEGGPGLS